MRKDLIYTFSELERLMGATKFDYLPPVKFTTKLTDSAVTVKIPVPGVTKDDISVRLDGHILLIDIADNFQYLSGWPKMQSSKDDFSKSYCVTGCELKNSLIFDYEKDFIIALENGVLVISIPLKNTKKEFVWA